MPYKYPKEFLNWVKKNGYKFTCDYMAKELFDNYEKKVKVSSLRNYLTRNGYKFKHNIFIRGSVFEDWQQDYIAWFCSYMSDQDLSDRLLLVYNVKHSAASIKNFRVHYKIKTGRTGHLAEREKLRQWQFMFSRGNHPSTVFKKGSVPWNTKDLGAESKTVDGYFVVKTKEGERWKLRARVIWEKVNGPIPKGMRLVHLDGNKENDSIENLTLCSYAESFNAVRAGMIEGEPELNQAIINIEKLKIRLNK